MGSALTVLPCPLLTRPCFVPVNDPAWTTPAKSWPGKGACKQVPTTPSPLSSRPCRTLTPEPGDAVQDLPCTRWEVSGPHAAGPVPRLLLSSGSPAGDSSPLTSRHHAPQSPLGAPMGPDAEIPWTGAPALHEGLSQRLKPPFAEGASVALRMGNN